MSATVACPVCDEENAYYNGRFYECPDCENEWSENGVSPDFIFAQEEYDRLIKFDKSFFQLEHGQLYECTVEHPKGTESTTIIPLAFEKGRNRQFILINADKLLNAYPQAVLEITDMDFESIMCDGLIDYPNEFEAMAVVVTTERDEVLLDSSGCSYLDFKKMDSSILNTAKITVTYQKQAVLNKWEELIQELSLYLEEVRRRGGTGGYKVGSVKEQQVKLREQFINL